MKSDEKNLGNFSPEIPETFESGFNIKTVIAALFIGFIMLPGAIYLGIITGGGLAGAAQWVAVILLVEIAKRSFVPLKKQEIYIVYIMAASLIAGALVLGTSSLVVPGGAFGELIWQQYLVQSPHAKAFGLTPHIPRWASPSPESEALLKRTFFHRDWLLPILVVIIHNLLFRINFFSLGYVTFRITSDREKLPFPMAAVASEGAMALAESSSKKETWRWRVFSISAMLGLIYGAFYAVIPTITGLMMTKPFQLLPIPWVDFTAQIGTIFPGCVLGFVTDLSALIAGFVIPFWVVIGSFVSSIAAQCFGNPVLFNLGILKNWQPGMSVIPTNVVATLDFWMNVTIGGGITVGLIGIWKLILQFKKKSAAAGVTQKPAANRGDYPIPIALGIWFVTTIIYIILCHILVPTFPIAIFILFGFILTPFLTYTSSRMFGITGVHTGASFPMVREASFILSGYRGADIWFAPVPYFDFGGTTQGFKQLELTRTRFTSWYKCEFTALAIMLFCSFFFWSVIWHLAPIPSSTYPYIQKIWPMNSIFKCLWATSTLDAESSWMIKAIRLKYIAGSMGLNFLLYGLIAIFKFPIALFYGFIGGVPQMPHYTIPLFAGAMLGRFYFAKRFGKETWRRYTPIILAGYSCGMGLIGMVSIAVALIAKTIYQLIF